MQKCISIAIFLIALFLATPWTNGEGQNSESPEVIATTPANGATDVDPSLSEISVTFNKPMQDKSWSWSYEEKSTFPDVAGQPYYTAHGTTCVLPVKLRPGKKYTIWINTVKFLNFKDTKGIPAKPFKLEFKTKQKGG